MKELSSGSRSRMRSSAASMTLLALTLPFLTAAAMSAAPLHINVSADVLSMEDRRRFGIVGQIERIDARCVVQHQAEMEFHILAPCRIDCQTERPRARDHKVFDKIGTSIFDLMASRSRSFRRLPDAPLDADSLPLRGRSALGFQFHGRGRNSSAK